MSLKKLVLMLIAVAFLGGGLYYAEKRNSIDAGFDAPLSGFSERTALEVSITTNGKTFTIERAKSPFRGEWGIRSAPDADVEKPTVDKILDTLKNFQRYNPIQNVDLSSRVFGFQPAPLRVSVRWETKRPNAQSSEKKEELIFGAQNAFSGRRYVLFSSDKTAALVDEYVFTALKLELENIRVSTPFQFRPPTLQRVEIERADQPAFSLQRKQNSSALATASAIPAEVTPVSRWLVSLESFPNSRSSAASAEKERGSKQKNIQSDEQLGEQTIPGDNEIIEKKLLGLSLLQPKLFIDNPSKELVADFSQSLVTVTLYLREQQTNIIRKIQFIEREEDQLAAQPVQLPNASDAVKDKDQKLGSRRYYAKFSDRPTVYQLKNRFALEFLQSPIYFALRKPLIAIDPQRVLALCGSDYQAVVTGREGMCLDSTKILAGGEQPDVAANQHGQVSEPSKISAALQGTIAELREFDFLSLLEAPTEEILHPKTVLLDLAIIAKEGSALRKAQLRILGQVSGKARDTETADEAAPRFAEFIGFHGQKTAGVVSGEGAQSLIRKLETLKNQAARE